MQEEFSYALEDSDVDENPVRRVAVATGYAAYPQISAMAREIEGKYENVKIDVYKIKNNFFGESITVSGLLTGRDIFEQLSGKLSCDVLLLPSCAIRASDEDFICGMKLVELSEKLGVKIRLCDNDGYDFLDAVLGK
jgi:NifB/MoaA-like Fe-S oxidoreductase